MIDTAGTFADTLVPIAQDLFTAMVDGEPGLLQPADDAVVPTADAVRARVDIVGPARSRVLVTTARSTAALASGRPAPR